MGSQTGGATTTWSRYLLGSRRKWQCSLLRCAHPANRTTLIISWLEPAGMPAEETSATVAHLPPSQVPIMNWLRCPLATKWWQSVFTSPDWPILRGGLLPTSKWLQTYNLSEQYRPIPKVIYDVTNKPHIPWIHFRLKSICSPSINAFFISYIAKITPFIF